MTKPEIDEAKIVQLILLGVDPALEPRGFARTGWLAKRCQISTRRMLSLLRKLERAGIVERSPRYSVSNEYAWHVAAHG